MNPYSPLEIAIASATGYSIPSAVFIRPAWPPNNYRDNQRQIRKNRRRAFAAGNRKAFN